MSRPARKSRWGGDSKEPVEVKNAFLWGELHLIKSVVYTHEEIDGFTVFYFSPTRGITDVDGMKEAGDFLKVCVDDAEDGTAIDFTKENNSVSYKDVVVDKGSIATVETRKFEIKLLNHKYVSLSFDFTMADGNVFRAEYYGDCRIWPYDETLEWDYIVEGSTVEALYNGDIEQNNTSHYQLLMATSTFKINGSQFDFDNDGYILLGDFYAESSAEISASFPTGTFKMSKYGEAGSYQGTLAWFEAGDPMPKDNPVLENDIVVSKEVNEGGQTIYTVELSFVDQEGAIRKMGYRGPIQIVSQSASLPSIDEDRTGFVGVGASASYMGNIFQTNTGMVRINLYDEIYDKEDEFGGFAASLSVFSQLFNGKNEPRLIPGEYRLPGSSFGEEFSVLEGQAVSMIGAIIPFGTYMHHDTGEGMGRFGFATSGTIKIEEKGTVEGTDMTNYLISFDFQTKEGKRMEGSYEGPVEVANNSDDDIKDDGTSTLESNYKMELGNIPEAHLFPFGELKYPLGDDLSNWRDKDNDGDVDDDDKDRADPPVGHQIIRIGRYADVDYILGEGNTGDTFSLGLVTRLGEDNRLAPGKYPIVLQNYPYYFKAGTALRGQFVTLGGITDMNYTLWSYYDINNPTWERDGHACIYEGYAEVIRDPKDETGVFTIKLDGYCARKYNVTGTWKGKVLVNGQPVEAADPFE